VKRVQFVVPGTPVGKGRPRASTIAGNVHIRTPTKTRNYEAKVAACARNAARRPLDAGPLRITVVAVFARPKRLQRKKDPADRIRHDRGPTDASNILKAIEDGAEGVLYKNDSRIAEARVEKWWAAKGEAAHTLVVVETLT